MTPVSPGDAVEMTEVLADPALYVYTGGSAPTAGQLEARYRAQVTGSPDPGQVWHNWIIRENGDAVGFVQATVTDDEAEVAWVVGVPWQGRGVAREAASAMCDWLAGLGVNRLLAHIHPDNIASARVASALGMGSTGRMDEDDEMVWELVTS
jgi:RimJ/RimL family protein N-acetyltransferase